MVGLLGFSRESLKNIEDGTSHTLMAGESASHTKLEYRTLWAYSHSFFSLSATIPQARTLWGDYDRCRDAGGVGYGTACTRGWGRQSSFLGVLFSLSFPEQDAYPRGRGDMCHSLTRAAGQTDV